MGPRPAGRRRGLAGSGLPGSGLPARRPRRSGPADADPGDLRVSPPVPGGRSSPQPATLEQFPLVGETDRLRHAVSDFESLQDPPGEGCEVPWDEAGETLASEPPADFRTIWRGCSWLRHCHRDQALLPEPEWRSALSIAGRSAAPGVDGRSLARRFSERHPGYTRSATDDELARALGRKSGPASCRHAAEALGAWEEHCSRCPSHGRIEGPIDLGRIEPPGEPEGTSCVAATPASPVVRPDQAGEAPGGSQHPLGGRGGGMQHPLGGRGGDIQLEVVLRAPVRLSEGAGKARSGVPAANDLLRAALACLGLPRHRSAAAGDSVPAALVEGLEEALAALGGEATVRQLLDLLAAEEKRPRFPRLRSALCRLFPALEDGELPAPRSLGLKLRRYAGRGAGGRIITQVKKSSRGATWTVRSPTHEPKRR